MEHAPIDLSAIAFAWETAFNKRTEWVPVKGAVRLLRNKWAILVLIRLSSNKPLRFGVLREALDDISPKVFTNTLRELEQLGLITRFEHDQSPPRVDYTITEVGETFLSHIVGLVTCVLHQQEKKRLLLS